MLSSIIAEHTLRLQEECRAEQSGLPHLLGTQKAWQREGWPKFGKVLGSAAPPCPTTPSSPPLEQSAAPSFNPTASDSLYSVEVSVSTAATASELSPTKRSLKDFDGHECHLPSVGSELHSPGKCRPCGWFWKPEGCKNGAECRHCHLCPKDEIKNRKKAKDIALLCSALQPPQSRLDSLSSTHSKVSASLPGNHECRYPAGEGVLEPLPLASVGSELHNTGKCRPCAWYYKPGGCKNGYACQHCHACPEGEIRARRKEKAAVMRLEDLVKLEACLEVPSSVGSPRVAQAHVGFNSLILPSCGSLLCGTGLCKPCRWFWKPNGCKNGRGCNYCHACPKEAIIAHKRTKAQAMLSTSQLSVASHVQADEA